MTSNFWRWFSKGFVDKLEGKELAKEADNLARWKT